MRLTNSKHFVELHLHNNSYWTSFIRCQEFRCHEGTMFWIAHLALGVCGQATQKSLYCLPSSAWANQIRPTMPSVFPWYSLWFQGQEKNAQLNTGLNSVLPSLLRIASWEMNPPLDQWAMLKCFPCRQCLGGKCSSDTKPGVALLGTSLLRISHCLATFSFDILEELHAAAAKACALGLYEKVLKRKLRAELKCVWMCHRKDGRSQNSSRKLPWDSVVKRLAFQL